MLASVLLAWPSILKFLRCIVRPHKTITRSKFQPRRMFTIYILLCGALLYSAQTKELCLVIGSFLWAGSCLACPCRNTHV
ncbi:hypothetical protein PRUPE_1G270500 [Prunus persica]|uniref:Uncharacterized protein n=1 Tax=Prunus persica TaxID=3760 RepID=A0A251R414_PRUPE|nr:hypothetical protein PRUPE_1G270500 [Prunus persica]